MNFAEQFIWIVFCVYFESGSNKEPDSAREMVAHCVLNRAVKRKLTYKEVVQEKEQFSWFNRRKVPDIKYPLAFANCSKAVWKAYLNHQLGYNYGGVSHFHDNSVMPYWAPSMKRLGAIGSFQYYKEG